MNRKVQPKAKKKVAATKRRPKLSEVGYAITPAGMSLILPKPLVDATMRPSRYGVSMVSDGVQTLVYFSRAAYEPCGWVTLINIETPTGKRQDISVPLHRINYAMEETAAADDTPQTDTPE